MPRYLAKIKKVKRKSSIQEQQQQHIEPKEDPLFVTSTDSITRKLDEITTQMDKLCSTMNVLKSENSKLKKDNNSLKLAFNQICCTQYDETSNVPCTNKNEKKFAPPNVELCQQRQSCFEERPILYKKNRRLCNDNRKQRRPQDECKCTRVNRCEENSKHIRRDSTSFEASCPEEWPTLHKKHRHYSKDNTKHRRISRRSYNEHKRRREHGYEDRENVPVTLPESNKYVRRESIRSTSLEASCPDRVIPKNETTPSSDEEESHTFPKDTTNHYTHCEPLRENTYINQGGTTVTYFQEVQYTSTGGLKNCLCSGKERESRTQGTPLGDTYAFTERYWTPQNINLDATDIDDSLFVQSVDVCICANGCSHQTVMFDLVAASDKPQLVIRRGKCFELEITLNRPYNYETDGITFIFIHKMAEFPSIGRKTLIILPIAKAEEKYENSWSAFLDKLEGNTISVMIKPAPDALIGKWGLEIDTMTGNQVVKTYKYDDLIYVLFNPWCNEDDVFMEDDCNREEYVLTEVGIIWKGTIKQPQCAVWKYGQFDKDVLDCSLLLLEKGSKIPLGDPIMVGRVISTVITRRDECGVLSIDETEDFSGGKKPTEWIGSAKILEKYYRSQKPVKYGQGFILTGIATTVFRALGIPSRTVTSYKSPNDHDSNLALDIFIDCDCDKEIQNALSSDKIWDYHVWNEIWTRRPDLDARYDGWQVLDNTTQDLNCNLNTYGPAPLTAVKNGDVEKPYDVRYLYSQVNASILYWKFQGPAHPLKLLATDISGIGNFISTKAVGSFEREDLTDQYKYKDKSKEERLVLIKMLRKNDQLKNRYYLNENFEDLKFELKLLEETNIPIGGPISILLNATNLSHSDHHVTVRFKIIARSYNGYLFKVIKNEEMNITVAAKSEENLVASLNYGDLCPFISLDVVFHIRVLCQVNTTDYEFFAQEYFRILLPSISIKIEGTPATCKILYGTACFKNPLPETLKNCVYLIEGPGLAKGLKYKIEDVPPNCVAKVNFKMTPTFCGNQTIVAKFNSRNLSNIDGFLTICLDEGDDRESDC